MPNSVSVQSLNLNSHSLTADQGSLYLNDAPINGGTELADLDLIYSGSLSSFGPFVKIISPVKFYNIGIQSGYFYTGLWIDNFEYYETGNLNSNSLSYLNFQNLAGVNNNFNIYGSENITVDCPELKIIGGNIFLTGNNFKFPKLKNVIGDYKIFIKSGTNPDINDINSIGGSLSLSIETGYYLDGTPRLINFFTGLKEVGDNIYIPSWVITYEVTGIQFSSVERIGGISGLIIQVSSNTLQYVNLPSLKSGNFILRQSSSPLTGMSLPLYQNGMLRFQSAHSIRYITNSGAFPSSIFIPNATDVGLELNGGLNINVDLPLVTGNSRIDFINSVATGFYLPNLKTAKNFVFSNGFAVNAFNADKLENAESIEFYAVNTTAPKVALWLNFPSVQYISSGLILSMGPGFNIYDRVTGINFDNLTGIGQNLIFNNRTGQTIVFPRLVSIGHAQTSVPITRCLDLYGAGTNYTQTYYFNNLKSVGSNGRSAYALGHSLANTYVSGIYMTGIEELYTNSPVAVGAIYFGGGWSALKDFRIGSGLRIYQGNQAYFTNSALNLESIEDILVSFSGLDGTNGKTLFSGATKSILLNGGTISGKSRWTSKSSGAFHVLTGRGVAISFNA